MKKVMVFGTYDLVHSGHLSFFKQAKKLGDYLIVVVARDENSARIKGRFPRNDEKTRLANVRKVKLVDKAILGSRTYNFYRTIRTHKPVTIALGYDQKPSIRQLKKDLRKHRLANVKIVRLRPYKPQIYKSSKLLNSDSVVS
jgi:FAD synthetase